MKKYKTFSAALNSDELMELLASLEHDRWAGWETYRNRPEVSSHDEERWARQRITPYSDLSESEKESDRKEVRKTILTILTFLVERYEP